MRVIEREMVAAIRERLGADQTAPPWAWRKDNTQVVRHAAGYVIVSLHGHRIAEVHDDGTVKFTLAGWNTPTTRSRVNAILREFTAGYGVTCHKFSPYVCRHVPGVNHREEISSNAWVTISADGCLVSTGAA